MHLKDPTLLRMEAFVNGEWVSAARRATYDVVNPATGEKLGTAPDMGSEETRQAIEAAAVALPAWARLTAKERGAILRRWHDLMMSNQDDLATIMTAEQGKPLAESKGEVAYAAAFVEWFAEEGKRLYGEVIPTHQPDKRILVLRQPIGVVAAITPWNFPAAMITRKAGPALAAGCTFVCKPAQQTPYSALAMAGARTTRRVAAWRVECDYRSAGHSDRCRDDLQPNGPESDFHGIDRGGEKADGAIGGHVEKAFPRARWQCAVHRVRGCGSGRRRGGRYHQQIP